MIAYVHFKAFFDLARSADLYKTFDPLKLLSDCVAVLGERVFEALHRDSHSATDSVERRQLN